MKYIVRILNTNGQVSYVECANEDKLEDCVSCLEPGMDIKIFERITSEAVISDEEFLALFTN